MAEQVDETFMIRRELAFALADAIEEHEEPAVVVGDFILRRSTY